VWHKASSILKTHNSGVTGEPVIWSFMLCVSPATHSVYRKGGKKTTTITPTIFGAVAQNVAAWATRRPGSLHTCGTFAKAQPSPPLTLFLITVPSDLLCEWMRTSSTATSANCSSPTYKLTHLKQKKNPKLEVLF